MNTSSRKRICTLILLGTLQIITTANANAGTAYYNGRPVNFSDCQKIAEKIVFKTPNGKWISQDSMFPSKGYTCLETDKNTALRSTHLGHTTSAPSPLQVYRPTQEMRPSNSIERVLMPCPNGTTQQEDGTCAVTSNDFVPRKRRASF
ncbi:MAG: hypothetical protein ACPGVT_12545 [Maricaulaceae bacterium]